VTTRRSPTRGITFVRSDGSERSLFVPHRLGRGLPAGRTTSPRRGRREGREGRPRRSQPSRSPSPTISSLTFLRCADGRSGPGSALPAADPRAPRRVRRQLVAHRGGRPGRRLLVNPATVRTGGDDGPPPDGRCDSISLTTLRARASLAPAFRPTRRPIPGSTWPGMTSRSCSSPRVAPRAPKGVMVTHRNLAAQLATRSCSNGLRGRIPSRDRGRELASALPRHGAHRVRGRADLRRGAGGFSCRQRLFVRRPSSWLDAVNRYRGTITFAPNFAYSLAVQGISPRQMEGWDLSCVRAHRLRRRADRPGDGARILGQVRDPWVFAAPPSFHRTVLAEATLAVTFLGSRRSARDRRRRAARPSQGQRGARHQWARGGFSCRVVALFPRNRVDVVDKKGVALGERQVGGESSSRGRASRRAISATKPRRRATFRGGRLFTGDPSVLR